MFQFGTWRLIAVSICIWVWVGLLLYLMHFFWLIHGALCDMWGSVSFCRSFPMESRGTQVARVSLSNLHQGSHFWVTTESVPFRRNKQQVIDVKTMRTFSKHET